MKITGFSFIRNAVKFHYPIAEAVQSILPLCDEVVVAVGKSDDNTKDVVAALSPKIRIIDTVWDEGLREGGRVLAVETDKAFQAISPDSDWCIYIQGDEVMHEDGHEEVRKAMKRWKDDKNVDGLLFKYRHFYGSYDYIGVSSNWYRHEIRVIKNNKSFYSYKDAQGFRKGDNQKLNVKPLNAYIHHYGWVREPETMTAKQNNWSSLYTGGDQPLDDTKLYTGAFDYKQIDALERFTGKHPMVMQDHIKRMNWKFDYDLSYNKQKPKELFKNMVEKLTGKRPFDYKNYNQV